MQRYSMWARESSRPSTAFWYLRSLIRSARAARTPGSGRAYEEDTAYAYISAEALPFLGESAQLDQLKLTAVDDFDRRSIERTATGVAAFVQGVVVENIQIPPPLQHPHQSPMDTLLFMFLVFGGVTLVLSAILVAAMLNQMLTPQIPQIASTRVAG